MIFIIGIHQQILDNIVCFGIVYLDNERVDIPDSWKNLHLHWNSISEQVDILLSDKIQQKL